MSVPIFLPITINVENAIQPTAGDPVFAQTGEQFVITNPSTHSQDPVVIIGPNDGGIVTVASGTPGANVVFAGDSDTKVEIGTAFSIDATGSSKFLSGAGSAFQVDSTFEGSVIANLSGSLTDGPSVDLELKTQFGGTIADAAGGVIESEEGVEPLLEGEFSYYLNGGAGNDQLKGSQASDFIRGGAGNDNIDGGTGDDLIRVGSGDDTVELGAGADVLYWTVDQFEGDSVNTIRDFTSGEDIIAIESEVASRIDVVFAENGQAFTVTLLNEAGDIEGTTVVISENDEFDFPNDFAFV